MRLVFWTFLTATALTLLAFELAPPVVATLVWITGMLAVGVAGCVALVARSAWLHRFCVFTNMKARDGQRKC